MNTLPRDEVFSNFYKVFNRMLGLFYYSDWYKNHDFPSNNQLNLRIIFSGHKNNDMFLVKFYFNFSFQWNVTQKRDSLFSIYRIVPNYEKLESWKSFEEIENLFKEKGKFRKPAVSEILANPIPAERSVMLKGWGCGVWINSPFCYFCIWSSCI